MKELKPPFFVFDVDVINRNIELLKKDLSILPKSQLCYSLKTNNIPYLIDYLYKKDIFIEVVSNEEYEYAKNLNISLDKVVFNGPIKSYDDLKEAIINNSYINIDSLEELNTIVKLKEIIKKYHYAKLGIRINPYFNKKLTNDLIGYDSSRFGLDPNEFSQAIKVLSDNNIALNGLHIHINHDYDIFGDYELIIDRITKLIKKYHLSLKYIDMGGGILRSTESVDYSKCIELIKNEFNKVNIDINNVCFMIEPGAAIMAQCGYIEGEILTKKKIKNTYYYSTNISKHYFDITNKFKEWKHFEIKCNSKKIVKKQIICGFTCMENDRILTLENQQELNIGDKVIINKIGAYSINFIPFFIKGLPQINIVNKDKLLKTYHNITIWGLYNERN